MVAEEKSGGGESAATRDLSESKPESRTTHEAHPLPLVLVIQASSAGPEAGNFAKISLNDCPVPIEDKHGDSNQRGLHILVVNPATGKIHTASVFDTYARSSEFDDFIEGGIPRDFIVVAACKGDCSLRLSLKAKYWFAKMGSKEIWRLDYR